MPRVYFPSLTCPVSTVMDVATFRIKKNIGRGAKCRVTSVVDVGRTGRVRSRKPEPIEFTTQTSVRIRAISHLRPMPLKVSSVVEVKSFVATVPPAPPVGVVHLATIAEVLNGSTTRLKGARLIKGDLIPLTFKVTGQKLDGLGAELVAKRKDDPTAAVISKSGSAIHLTDPSIDPMTNTEVLMGQFAIEASDTIGLPDQEVEYAYQLKFSDGNGRIYTVELGYFTVYPAF